MSNPWGATLGALAVARWVNVGAVLSRRWLLVGAGAAALVAAGVVDLPAPAAGAEPAEVLRQRIAGSAAQPYVGLAEATGRLGLPDLPQLEQVSALFTGTTRIRAFHAGPDRWRVDELTPAGERDTFRLGDVEAVWDFGSAQLTRVTGETPVRLPRAADLLPPDLARRILAAAPTDPVTSLPPRRVAGRAADGIRLTAADPDTTVAHVDIWADPPSGLPLAVEIAGRADPGRPLLTSRLTAVDLVAPDAGALTPQLPPGASRVDANAADLTGALRVVGAPAPPARLAGRDRRPRSAGLPGVGIYGSGLAAFVLVPLGRRAGRATVERAAAATAAGAVEVAVPAGRAVRLSTSLLTLVVRAADWRGELLVGTVAPEVLERAAVELSPGRPG